MRYLVACIVIILSSPSGTFKDEQMKYPRVRNAFSEKEALVESYLSAKGINLDEAEIYLRAFKRDKKIEVWARNRGDATYQKVKTYKVCRTSGQLGPKRKQGDLQIPEGFYHINIFNPYSNFHLSLGVNYPNKSDRILGVNGKLGGDIFIHGECVTIGCLPITNEQIKELYVLAVEARNNGQTKIPVTIFPAEMTREGLSYLSGLGSYEENKRLWSDLKKANDYFLEHKKLPSVTFLADGNHTIN